MDDHVLHLGGLADVARVAAGVAAAAGDLLGGLLRALGVQIDDGDLAALGGQRERVGLAQAAGAPGDEGDLVANAQIHQRPLNSGSRLAKNAWMPSAASSLLSVGMNASISTSIERAIGASSPSSTALMMAAIASGARLPS